MEIEGRPVFRCTFRLTDPKRKDIKPSNIFLAGESEEKVLAAATALYRDCMAVAGISGETFDVEIRPSSFEEAAEYAKSKEAGHSTTGMVS